MTNETLTPYANLNEAYQEIVRGMDLSHKASCNNAFHTALGYAWGREDGNYNMPAIDGWAPSHMFAYAFAYHYAHAMKNSGHMIDIRTAFETWATTGFIKGRIDDILPTVEGCNHE